MAFFGMEKWFGGGSHGMAENPAKRLERKEDIEGKDGVKEKSVGDKIEERDGNVLKVNFGGKKTGDEYEITPVPGQETVVRRRKKRTGEEELVEREETIGDLPSTEEKIDLK